MIREGYWIMSVTQDQHDYFYEYYSPNGTDWYLGWAETGVHGTWDSFVLPVPE